VVVEVLNYTHLWIAVAPVDAVQSEYYLWGGENLELTSVSAHAYMNLSRSVCTLFYTRAQFINYTMMLAIGLDIGKIEHAVRARGQSTHLLQQFATFTKCWYCNK